MRKLISYSLYGNNPIYWLGLLNNIRVKPYVMPDWDIIVYIEQNHFLIPILTELNIQLDICSNDLGGTFGSAWRFYAMDRTDAEYILFRDADSILTYRDAWGASQWIQSGKTLFKVKDFPTKSPLCAGCFGIKGGVYPNIRPDVHSFIKVYGTSYSCDEAFLQATIWAKYQNDCYTCGNDGEPFPKAITTSLPFTGFKLRTKLFDVFNWNPFERRQV